MCILKANYRLCEMCKYESCNYWQWKVGSSLSSLLAREGHDVTVLDNKAEALKKTQYTQDIMCIEGNGATG